MHEPYLISVIMPVHNSSEFMARSLESILSQTYSHFELILVNDGSTDDTEKIALQYTIKDKRISYICQKNSGPGVARNKGIKIASGKFICFVDSDDYLEPKALSTMLEAMDEDTDLVQCRARKKYSDGRIDTDSWCNKYIELNSHQAMKDYLNNNPPLVRYAVWAKLIRKKAMEGIEFPKLNNSEDVVFTAYLIDKCRRIKFIPNTLYLNIVREGSLTHNNPTYEKLKAYVISSEMIREFIRSKSCYRQLYARVDWMSMLVYMNCAIEAKMWQIHGFSTQKMRKATRALHIDFKRLDNKRKIILLSFLTFPDLFIWILYLKEKYK